MATPDLATAPSATIALITGANKGIGFETARQLGERGLTVLVGARDEGRGEAAVAALTAEGLDARAVRLDVTDEESVKAAAAWVADTFGRLDVLVNNAGILVDAGQPVTETTAAQVRETYETNVFGLVAVTRAMIPLLARSRGGRIVNLSSNLGSLGINTGQPERLAAFQMLAYGSSKAAVNALTILYANALRGHGIKVNAVEPGFVATDINNHAGPGTAREGAQIVVRLATVGDDGPTATFQSAAGPVPW
ncbi:SDR family oxidoreductase [Pseudofrankia inefficax]|uniref:Short-chain dehydrogenase/reductase SDR n=1 Tax=Pseudofrankia inefficax (strain DSM 45817 / CECT 9037 / DDB 130130 / EuI1c) TaxID=298654 RepID=E3J3P2_PSEI1|nr:SDR family oxidoreductase [Pseudofrankia inefficax]ADP79379.1 short-chain dehydrogenase/reductase SDR [Pseudofrankia inefficax]